MVVGGELNIFYNGWYCFKLYMKENAGKWGVEQKMMLHKIMAVMQDYSIFKNPIWYNCWYQRFYVFKKTF